MHAADPASHPTSTPSAAPHGDDNTVAATLDIFLSTPSLNRWIFDRVRPWCGRRVLEVGAGIGNLTELLADRDLVVATELEDDFLDRLRGRFAGAGNVHIEKLDLEQVPVERFAGYHLDSVLCVNVLEHIRDDVGALVGLRDIVEPDGRLLLYVPAIPWLYGSLDKNLQHHRRYGKAELARKFEQAGWRLEHLSYMNLLGIPGWFLNSRVLGRKILPVKQVQLYDKLVPLLRLEDKLPLPIGMSLVAVGRKA